MYKHHGEKTEVEEKKKKGARFVPRYHTSTTNSVCALAYRRRIRWISCTCSRRAVQSFKPGV